jgi:hypothetical protein
VVVTTTQRYCVTEGREADEKKAWPCPKPSWIGGLRGGGIGPHPPGAAPDRPRSRARPREAIVATKKQAPKKPAPKAGAKPAAPAKGKKK